MQMRIEAQASRILYSRAGPEVPRFEAESNSLRRRSLTLIAELARPSLELLLAEDGEQLLAPHQHRPALGVVREEVVLAARLLEVRQETHEGGQGRQPALPLPGQQGARLHQLEPGVLSSM